MSTAKAKPMTNYERRKRLDERKKARGLTRKSYYQSQQDIEVVMKVKEQLAAQHDQATNEDALSHIISHYRETAL